VTALRDARGCLSEAGLRALEQAPLGRGPAELVGHVGTCKGCQERLLLRASGSAGPRVRREPPPLWRTFLALAATLLLALVALAVALRLRG
jgi:hypothetical protein